MSFSDVLVLKEMLLGPKRTTGPVMCKSTIFFSLPISFRELHTIFLVKPPKLEMTITFSGVVQLMKAADSAKKRARILGQRVKVESIDYQT